MRLVTFAAHPGAPWRTGVRTADGIVDLLAVHAACPGRRLGADARGHPGTRA